MKFSTLLKGFGIFAAAMSIQAQAQPPIYSNFTVCNNYPSPDDISVIISGANIHTQKEFISLVSGQCGEVDPTHCYQIDAFDYQCALVAQNNSGDTFFVGKFTATNNSAIAVENSEPWNGCIAKNEQKEYVVNATPPHTSSCPPALKK